MRLTDDELDAMVSRLRDKTSLSRFNRDEVLALVLFLQDDGCDLNPVTPEIVTVPREELMEIFENSDPMKFEPIGPSYDWTLPHSEQSQA